MILTISLTKLVPVDDGADEFFHELEIRLGKLFGVVRRRFGPGRLAYRPVRNQTRLTRVFEVDGGAQNEELLRAILTEWARRITIWQGGYTLEATLAASLEPVVAWPAAATPRQRALPLIDHQEELLLRLVRSYAPKYRIELRLEGAAAPPTEERPPGPRPPAKPKPPPAPVLPLPSPVTPEPPPPRRFTGCILRLGCQPDAPSEIATHKGTEKLYLDDATQRAVEADPRSYARRWFAFVAGEGQPASVAIVTDADTPGPAGPAA